MLREQTLPRKVASSTVPFMYVILARMCCSLNPGMQLPLHQMAGDFHARQLESVVDVNQKRGPPGVMDVRWTSFRLCITCAYRHFTLALCIALQQFCTQLSARA